jgi:hypothetical protein
MGAASGTPFRSESLGRPSRWPEPHADGPGTLPRGEGLRQVPEPFEHLL